MRSGATSMFCVCFDIAWRMYAVLTACMIVGKFLHMQTPHGFDTLGSLWLVEDGEALSVVEFIDLRYPILRAQGMWRLGIQLCARGA
jgi:hypothetical protein